MKNHKAPLSPPAGEGKLQSILQFVRGMVGLRPKTPPPLAGEVGRGPAAQQEEVDLVRKMLALRESGELEWEGQLVTHHSPMFPTIRLNSDLLASDLLLEDRR